MPFSDTTFDCDTVAMLTRVMDEVCDELGGDHNVSDRATRAMLAIRLIAATVKGERDPRILKELARKAVMG